MRKYLLISIVLAGFFPSSFSQTVNKEQAIRREIDSLKKALPNLDGIDRVDCLNTLAYKYLWLPLSEKQQIDFSSPYGLEANSEAKRIGYKKGLGFFYLR